MRHLIDWRVQAAAVAATVIALGVVPEARLTSALSYFGWYGVNGLLYVGYLRSRLVHERSAYSRGQRDNKDLAADFTAVVLWFPLSLLDRGTKNYGWQRSESRSRGLVLVVLLAMVPNAIHELKTKRPRRRKDIIEAGRSLPH